MSGPLGDVSFEAKEVADIIERIQQEATKHGRTLGMLDALSIVHAVAREELDRLAGSPTAVEKLNIAAGRILAAAKVPS